ncbi:murein L,D-transpeptidase catalytic domain family protein [Sphingomonas lenta]|uniref:Transcriptional initiation protein Tat n=1 Tax=Sphingomonas lenta TaxID=1141887 RepID=A0A2A2SF50_9SPHN|nr:murein L,D-transpeptidase catalytic domain family protein [Sphingomonas lenta]PAX07820.1 transcriptional initiation protein Tat [Sphingomonas lenta]
MQEEFDVLHARRALLKNGLVLAGSLAVPSAVAIAADRKLTSKDLAPVTAPPAPKRAAIAPRPVTSPRVVRPELMRKAMAALERHGNRVKRDRMAIVDFAAKSNEARFHFIDLASGNSTSSRVCHGSGSDPAHTGWLQRFSNVHGSNATSEGAYVTADYYYGKHGRSQRLHGLDRTNSNALERAIVIHGAWYANADVLRSRGVLGRSQGCFAFAENELASVFDRLGPGRLIYAAKV